MTDIIFCHFGPFFCHFASLTTWKIFEKLKKPPGDIIISFYTCAPWMTSIWCIVPQISSVMDAIVIFLFGLFLAVLLPNSPKNENFKKMKKIFGDVIILHKCTKNHDRMLYCPWDMAHDRCNCQFSFWAIFSPTTALTAQKIKIKKKKKRKKKPGDIIILHMCVPKIMIRWCTVSGKWCTMNERTNRRKKWQI